MSSNVADLFQQASERSDADRATLAALLIESLEPEPDHSADIEAAYEAPDQAMVEVPRELVPAVRELIAKRRA